MKALITDIDALRAVSPLAISAYARAEGWIRTERYGEHSDVFVRPGAPELVIPATASLGDYPAVVSDLIRLFSSVEDRSELQVYKDLAGADRDVVRVRAPEAEDDGSVRIEAGVELFSHARDLLLSAACAATEPRATYRAGKNKEAASYMDRVRLGQTEHGSFVVTLLAPVPPALQQPLQQELWPLQTEEPYDRLVTRRLADGLRSARKAAEEAIRGGEFQPFQRAILDGVSANMCEALSSLIERGEGLEVSITWARTRPTPEARRTIEFSRSDGEVFQEAARILRAHEPRPDEQLEGYVTGLDRKVSQSDGRITLKTWIDGRPVSVRTYLTPEAYSLALAAHDDRSAVALTGDLKRDGHRWQLDNPRDVRIVVDD